jgi:hypothetical protein
MDKSIVRPSGHYCDEKNLLFYNHSTDLIIIKQRCHDIHPAWGIATTLVNIKASALSLVTQKEEAPVLSVVMHTYACHLLHAGFLVVLF